MKHFKILALVAINFLFLFSFANAVTIENPLGTTDIQEIITNALNALLGIAGTIAVAMIVYGGIKIMISGGEQTKYDEAKKTITYAIIGLIIVIMAGAFINFILDVFK